MKGDIKTSIVSNSQPVYIALPVEADKDHDFEIMLEPIVAWKIRYSDDDSNHANFAEPILNNLFPDKYAIYNYETEIWSIPDYTSGKGLEELVKHFKERLQ